MKKILTALTAATVISATVLAMADTANAQWGYRAGFNRGFGYRGLGGGLGYRGLGWRGYGAGRGYAGYGGGYAGYADAGYATQATVVMLATAVELAEPRLLSPWLLYPQSDVDAPEGSTRGFESHAPGCCLDISDGKPSVRSFRPDRLMSAFYISHLAISSFLFLDRNKRCAEVRCSSYCKSQRSCRSYAT